MVYRCSDPGYILSVVRSSSRLLASLRSAVSSRPELVAFVPLAITAAGAAATGHRRALMVSKSLLVPTLQAGVLARRTGDCSLFLAATAGWLGDIVLLPAASERSPEAERRQLRTGAVAFGVQQVGYSALMWRRGVRPQVRRVAVVAAWLAALATLDARAGSSSAPDWVLTGYGVLLGGMTALAWSSGRGDLRAGGVLFLASDSVILVRELLLTRPWSRAAAEAFVLGTYASAQALLVGRLATDQQVAATWK